MRRVVHCSTVGVHGDVEHPPANEDAPLKPGDIYQDTKLEGERIAREAGERTGIEVTIVRPTGIYGPGDRRLLKLFRGVARGAVSDARAAAKSTTISPTLTISSKGFRLCGEHPAAANRTYILAGGEVTTLNELVQLVADVAGVPPPRVHLPVWPFWIAGALCEAVCVPFGIEPPLYRRRVDFYTKSRAFDITRAQDGDRLRAARRPARRHRADARLVSRTWLALRDIRGDRKAQDQLFAPGTSSRARNTRRS